MLGASNGEKQAAERVPHDSGAGDESPARGEGGMRGDAGQAREHSDPGERGDCLQERDNAAGQTPSDVATCDDGEGPGLMQDERSGQCVEDTAQDVSGENTRETQSELAGPVTTAVAVDVAASVSRSKTENKTGGEHVREAEYEEEETWADGGRGSRSSMRQSELFDSLDLSMS